ncbi:hypothetical protein H5410_021924 [Solanum commersonii]|uniref:DUF4283 domain-containing protein n=1 Tax=Solanum commersonii TaxID=4109 RepID=A0A9J5ZCF3_SOLCO|nr:hypothetical protein H5410_021924 [Solanum commersonii]
MLHADEPPPKPPLNYATNFNKVEDKITMPIPIKDINSIHGDPTVLWEEEEVQIMIIKRDLHVRFKPECKEGFLSDGPILIRLTNVNDYAHFNLEEETTIALAWVSYLSLSANFFVKESLFTMAKAVGKPLHVVMATISKSRPSFVMVKVEVDLLKEFLKRINVGFKKTYYGEIIST